MSRSTGNLHAILVTMLFIIVISILPIFVSCIDDDDDDDDSTDMTYMPLTVGNRWDFVVTADDGGGTGSALVKSSETFNGTTAIPVELTETSGQGLGTGNVYLTASNSQVNLLGAFFDSQQYTFNTPFTLVMFPLSVGKSWNSSTSITVEGIPVTINAATTVAALEAITVQGKNYTDCFKLVSDVSITFTVVIPITVSFPVQVWLAPNVGPVKGTMEIPSIPIFPELPQGDVVVEVTGTNF